MKTTIIGILLAIILVIIPHLPTAAQDDSTSTITVTMTGASEISITLSSTSWSPGDEGGMVSPNTEYETGPTWCTLTIVGNCNANTFIVSEDAVCIDDSAYKWTLSSNGENGEGVYALWFKVDGDTGRGDEEGYVIIPDASEDSLGEELWPWSGGGPPEGMAPGEENAIRFGLKLLTPEADFTKGGVNYFLVGDATMQTHVTISAVAA